MHSIAAKSESEESPGSYPHDTLTLLALIYLGIPSALFLGGWFKVPFALTFLLALCLGYLLAWRSIRHSLPPICCSSKHLILLGVAIFWASFGGAGHILYANRWDWAYRDAILHDLTVTSWPPGYDVGEAILWILRCPVGYYLPAALGGKIFGFTAADTFLWLWTIIGVWLFLVLLPIRSASYGKMGITVLVIILFSGMDILGWWAVHKVNPPIYKHMEWWAGLFQYSSNTTLLFWTPNHAIPAWIASTLFWRHWKTDAFLTIAPFLLGLLPLWSPFPVIGMAPFYALLLIRLVREKKWHTINLPLLGISLLLMFVAISYLTIDISNIPSDFTFNRADVTTFTRMYTVFVLSEFGLLNALLWKASSRQIRSVVAALLFVLPFLHYGPSNDIVMRASVPALTLLCIATITFLQQEVKALNSRRIVVYALLGLGATTASHEFYRAISLPSWKPDRTLNAMNFATTPPSTYTARYEPTWRTMLLRDVTDITKTHTAEHPIQFLPEEIP